MNCKTDDDVRNKIFELTSEEDPQILFPTGYPKAFVGIYYNTEVDMYGAVYSEDLIIQQLMLDFKGDIEEDEDLYTSAREYYDYNIAGSHFSEFAPVLYIRTE